MTTIIFIIIGLVAGYFFLTKFEKIDRALFSSVKNYQPFGILIVYLSAIIGAVFGCLFLYKQMIDTQVNLDNINFTIIMFLSMLICASIFQTFIYLDSAGSIIGKSVFMIVSCALAMVIGAVASVVIICLVILYLILMILGKAAFSSTSSSGSSSSSNEETERITTTDENGFERELKDQGFGSYRDDHGRQWKDNYDGTVSRDD